MSNICHICGRDIVSPVDPVCVCAEEAATLRARIAELERDIGWLLRFIDQLDTGVLPFPDVMSDDGTTDEHDDEARWIRLRALNLKR